MRRVVLGILAGLSMIACDSDTPTTPGGISTSYWAPLNAASEVPPNNSPAVGQANFRLNSAGTVLTYDLTSKAISNIVQAHIHLAPEGANGQIVQFLFGLVPAGSGPQVNDVVATGTIDGSTFTGPLTGRPFSELIAAIEAGNAYVNVHTRLSTAPATNQPGDIPAGEIRGQIRKVQ